MLDAISQNPLKCPIGPSCPRLRVVAVVLAAGTASRMGGRPKCLLQRDGQALLNRLLTALETAGIDETVLVLGHNSDIIQASLAHRVRAEVSVRTSRSMAVHQVLNPAPTDGQNSSLHLGLAKAQDLKPDWLMVALADQPLIDGADLQALIAAVKASPAGTQMLQPWVEGQPGNPVMFSQLVMFDLLNHSKDALPQANLANSLPGGKEWRQMYPQHFYRWPTLNFHYKVDMDTTEDIEALRAQYGIDLIWGTHM